jgi:outer membrane protein assembly factor BamA
MDRSSVDKGLGFFNDTSFLVVPIPVSNPTIGSGAALAAAMFFKTDEASKSSLLGTGGFYTDNGSWGAAIMADVAFDEDRYRAKASAGYASVSYDFYGIGSASAENGRHVSLNQSGDLFQASFEGRVAPQFYIGGQARYMTIKTKFDLPDEAGDILDNGGPLSQIKNSITTFGLIATRDSRNKDYGPTEGALIDAAFDVGLHDFITNDVFMRTTVSYSRYDTVATDLVLASHGALCAEGGKVPIFDLCMFGAQNDLRGYAVGRYQDKAMFAAQEELRWHAFWRVGFVAFAGVGSVAPALNRFDKMLYSGGGGLRFLASKEYGVNIGLDGAVNAQGEATYYIQVGEAF